MLRVNNHHNGGFFIRGWNGGTDGVEEAFFIDGSEFIVEGRGTPCQRLGLVWRRFG